LFDTHCHFNLDAFENDLDDIISVSNEQGIDRFLVPGVDLVTSERSLSISKRYPGVVFSAVGIHPSYSEQSNADEIEKIITTNKNAILAIGEIGLDYYRNYSPHEKQLSTLKDMLSLAHKYDLPVCLHNRDASEELLQMLSTWYRKNGDHLFPKGVFHAYDGSKSISDWGVDHGYYFGIGGMLTYKKNEVLRNQVCEIGIDQIVLETDSPYLTPTPLRGERNYPGNLNIIVETLSRLLEIDKEVVTKKTDENANRLFGLN
jgi:TatD DNase family protein